MALSFPDLSMTGNLISPDPVTVLFKTLLLIRSLGAKCIKTCAHTHTWSYVHICMWTHTNMYTHIPFQTYLHALCLTPTLCSMSVSNWNSESNACVTEEKQITLNAIILVTLKNLIFSQIIPSSQADGWKWQSGVSLWSKERNREKCSSGPRKGVEEIGHIHERNMA